MEQKELGTRERRENRKGVEERQWKKWERDVFCNLTGAGCKYFFVGSGEFDLRPLEPRLTFLFFSQRQGMVHHVHDVPYYFNPLWPIVRVRVDFQLEGIQILAVFKRWITRDWWYFCFENELRCRRPSARLSAMDKHLSSRIKSQTLVQKGQIPGQEQNIWNIGPIRFPYR